MQFNRINSNKVQHVYAQYQSTKVSLTYMDRGTTYKIEEYTKGSNVNIAENTNSGGTLKFLGWDTNSTAKNAVFKVGDTFEISYNMTLYAVWELDKVSLTYMDRGSIYKIEEYTKGSKVDIAENTNSKEEYKFVGWDTSASAKEVVCEVGDTFKILSDTTLYAVWELDKVSLTYMDRGSIYKIEEYTKGSNVNIAENTNSMKGYKFIGWSFFEGDYSVLVEPGEEIGNLISDIILYAVWEPEAPKREDLYNILGDFVKVHCISDITHYDKDKYYSIVNNPDIDEEDEATIYNVYYFNGKYLCNIDFNGIIYSKIFSYEMKEEHVLDSVEPLYKSITIYYDDLEEKWKPLNDIELPIVFNVRCNNYMYIGKYIVKHEYYLKDKNGNLILENKTSENEEFIMFEHEERKKVGISTKDEKVDIEIEKKPYYNRDNIKYIYEYFENSGNVIILPNQTKEIVLKYVREEENETKIKVEKIWEDENNKYGKRPESIVLHIKNGEEVIAEMEVSEENSWSSELVLSKYDKDGNEIKYTVDEKETSKFYEKRIDGYKVINKYIGEEPKDENNNEIIKDDENVDTSDINILMYVGIAIISIVVVIIVIFLVKKNNKKSK